MSGSSVVVSGGASGLGAAVVRRFRGLGHEVVFIDPNEEGGGEVSAETGATQVVGDVTREDEVIRAIEAAERLAPLRVAVCCAGVGWASRVV
ncbi:MAG: SDR family NAD(P)-dependent oxidoreductase, partial [Myxococcota bacterium]